MFRPLLFAILLLPGCLSSQHNVAYQADFYAAYKLSQQRRYNEARVAFEKYLISDPTNSDAQVMASWCSLAAGDVGQANKYADNALLLEQYQNAPYQAKAYAAYAAGNTEAENYLKTFFWLAQDASSLQNVVNDCDELIKAKVQPEIFKKVKALAPTLFAARDLTFQKANNFLMKGSDLLAQQQFEASMGQFDKAIQYTDQFPQEYAYMKPVLLFQLGEISEQYNYPAIAVFAFEMGLAEVQRFRNISPYTKIIVATKAGTHYYSSYDNEKAFTVLSSNHRHLALLPEWTVNEQGRFLQLLCSSIGTRYDRYDKMGEYATELMNLTSNEAILTATFQARGNLFYGLSYMTGRGPNDRATAKKHFDYALEIAQNNNLTEIINTANEYLSMYHFSVGENDKAYAILKKSAEDAIQKQDYFRAQMLYNNLGAYYTDAGDLGNAVTYLKKSIEIVDKYRNVFEGELKMNFIAEGSKSYAFMVDVLATHNDHARLFEAQNNQRGRLLSEALADEKLNIPVSLTEFQKLIKADEACLLYSEISPGKMVMSIITNTNAYVANINERELFVNLKKKYLDQINTAAQKPGYKPVDEQAMTTDLVAQITASDMDDMMQLTRDLLQKSDPATTAIRNELLQSYYSYLIKPATGKIGVGIKKLVIMPDGIYNFLPFEALIDSNGKHLVESFDIRYVQSPQVKKLIGARAYGARPKSLLAMGGAIYQNMKETAEPIRGTGRLLQLQTHAYLNAVSEKPQRELYAALGFSQMPYLPGTLEEVTTIRKFFDGPSTVLTGDQMTENKLKELSNTGELKNFRVVHLATHGFVIPQIPSLSGLAMCIFPEMQNGEDGYLTAPEIAKLNMQADVAVLSACETGLGKIYGGEGVSGLTQSLLIGGANRAIVSLWPVDDEGTMQFMKGLYELTETKGKTYDEAVNLMKRKFIKGEYGDRLSSTKIWAPFIHYGK